MSLWEKSGIAFLLALIFAVFGWLGVAQIWTWDLIPIDEQVKEFPPPSRFDSLVPEKLRFWGGSLLLVSALGSALFCIGCLGILLVRWSKGIRYRFSTNSSIE